MKFIKLHIAASGQVFWVNAEKILEMFPQGPEGKSGTKLYYAGKAPTAADAWVRETIDDILAKLTR